MPRAPIVTSIRQQEQGEGVREHVDPAAAPAQTDAEAGAGTPMAASPAPSASIRDDNPNSVSPELSPAGSSSKGGLSTRGVLIAMAAAGIGLILLISVLIRMS